MSLSAKLYEVAMLAVGSSSRHGDTEVRRSGRRAAGVATRRHEGMELWRLAAGVATCTKLGRLVTGVATWRHRALELWRREDVEV